MRVGCVADAVELQIGVAQPGVRGCFTEVRPLRELDAIGGRLYALIAQLAAVTDGIDEVWRKRSLAARDLHEQLPPRFDGDRVVEQRLDLFPAQLVHEAHL